MSTQINTLPAIRALLWERWRVMRWVVLAGLSLYMVIMLTPILDGGRDGDAVSFDELFLHETTIPLIIALCVMCNFVFTHDGRSYRFGLLERSFRLPVTNRFLTVSSLVIGHAWMLLMFGCLLLATAWIYPQFPVPLDVALGTLLMGSLLISVMQVWFSINTNEFFSLPIVLLLPPTAIVSAGNLDMVYGSVLAACACGAAATGGAWVYGLRRNGWLGEAYAMLNPLRLLPAPRALPSPSVRGPMAMLIWYEWRRWGWILVLLVFLAGLIPVVMRFVWPDQVVEDDGELGWFLVFAFAVGVGAIQTAQESHYGTNKPSDYRLLRPVSTRSLALGRILGTTSILLSASLLVLCGTTLVFGSVPPAEAASLAFLLFCLAWTIVHAWIMMFFLTCIGQSLLVPVYVVLLVLGPTASSDWETLQYQLMVGIVLTFVIYISLVVLIRRVVPLWMMLTWILVFIAIPVGAAFLLTDLNTRLATTNMLILLPIAISASILWQVYWLDRCRHR